MIPRATENAVAATCRPRACSWTTLAESNYAYAVFLHTAWLVVYVSLWKYT